MADEWVCPCGDVFLFEDNFIRHWRVCLKVNPKPDVRLDNLDVRVRLDNLDVRRCLTCNEYFAGATCPCQVTTRLCTLCNEQFEGAVCGCTQVARQCFVCFKNFKGAICGCTIAATNVPKVRRCVYCKENFSAVTCPCQVTTRQCTLCNEQFEGAVCGCTQVAKQCFVCLKYFKGAICGCPIAATNVPQVRRCVHCKENFSDVTCPCQVPTRQCSLCGAHFEGAACDCTQVERVCFGCLKNFKGVVCGCMKEAPPVNKKVRKSYRCSIAALARGVSVLVCPFCKRVHVTRQADLHFVKHMAVKDFLPGGKFSTTHKFTTPQQYACQLRDIAIKGHQFARAQVLDIETTSTVASICLFIPNRSGPLGFMAAPFYFQIENGDYETAIKLAENEFENHVAAADLQYGSLDY